MNLHGIVANAIGAVNPLVSCTMQASTGYTIGADGTQAPSYAAPVSALCQVQELTSRDLMHLDALNIQGSTRKVYLNGQWRGVVRPASRGGDLLTLSDGTVYLTTGVLEMWPDWTCVAVTLQNGS